MEKQCTSLMVSGPHEGLIQLAARILEDRQFCKSPMERALVTAVRKQVDLTYILEKETGFGNKLVLRCTDEGQRTLKAASSVSGLSNGVTDSAMYSEEEERIGAGLGDSQMFVWETVRCSFGRQSDARLDVKNLSAVSQMKLGSGDTFELKIRI